MAPNERPGLAFEVHLPVFIEIGIVGAGTGGRDRVEALKHKRDPDDEAIRRDRAAIDDYLLGTFARPEPGAPARKRSEHLLLAADLLADRRRDTDQTFDRVFYLPQDTAERQAVEALVRELKRDYKAIAFLGPDPVFRQERADPKAIAGKERTRLRRIFVRLQEAITGA